MNSQNFEHMNTVTSAIHSLKELEKDIIHYFSRAKHFILAGKEFQILQITIWRLIKNISKPGIAWLFYFSSNKDFLFILGLDSAALEVHNITLTVKHKVSTNTESLLVIFCLPTAYYIKEVKMTNKKKKTKKRKNTGKLFEHNIERSLLKTTYYYRLKDSAGAWSKGKEARFTPSNICDYIIFFNCSLYMVEAKSTKGKSLPFSNIRKNQIKEFKKLEKQKEKTKNLHGLFLIEFSDLKETYAVLSGDVLEYIETADRKSIPIDWLNKKGIKLGIKKGKRKQIIIEENLEKIKERKK